MNEFCRAWKLRNPRGLVVKTCTIIMPTLLCKSRNQNQSRISSFVRSKCWLCQLNNLPTLNAVLLRGTAIMRSLSSHHMVTGLLWQLLILNNRFSRWNSSILPVTSLGRGGLDRYVTLGWGDHFSGGGGGGVSSRGGRRG